MSLRRLVIVGLLGALCGCGARNDPAQLVSQLQAALRDKSAQTRRDAAKALGGLGAQARPAVPDLASALRDPDDEVRVRSATALWALGRDARDAAPALITALKDKNADVRLSAAGALGEA